MRFELLHRLREGGRSLVTDDFMRGEFDSILSGELDPHLEECAREWGLAELDGVVDALVEEFAPRAVEMDSVAGPRIYEALPLDRRTAADPGIWRFLAVAYRPDFVRHRWEFATRASTLPRYWEFGTRPNSNAFGRLWWITHLTQTDGDYRQTRTVLSNQALANSLFSRSFSRYRPLVLACCKVLGEKSGAVIEETLRRLNSRLSTIVLEGRDRGELVQLVAEIRDGVETRG